MCFLVGLLTWANEAFSGFCTTMNEEGFAKRRAEKQDQNKAHDMSSFKGLKERPLKGPFGLYRGFMRLYKGYIRVREGIWIKLGVPSRGPSYCPVTSIDAWQTLTFRKVLESSGFQEIVSGTTLAAQKLPESLYHVQGRQASCEKLKEKVNPKP